MTSATEGCGLNRCTGVLPLAESIHHWWVGLCYCVAEPEDQEIDEELDWASGWRLSAFDGL